MGIYDIFAKAAQGVESTPWRWRALAGVGVGAAYEGINGDPDLSVTDRIAKGATIGLGLGLGAGYAVRGLGGVAAGAEKIAGKAVRSKVAAVQKTGYKALLKPGSLMVGGAIAGATLAPDGHKTQGALAGAGIGLFAKPAISAYHGFEGLAKVPGLQTGVLLAAAAVPVAAVGVFGKGTPENEGSAIPGVGGTMDYEPLSGSMADKMVAMNASGDVVLGAHGRRHG